MMSHTNDWMTRYLQANHTITSNATNSTTSTTTTVLTMGQVAATTLKIYGVIFLALFLVYLLFRPIYIAAYNARGYDEVGHKNRLAYVILETCKRFSWLILSALYSIFLLIHYLCMMLRFILQDIWKTTLDFQDFYFR